ncbi:MAG: hypothetical protein WC184_12785 [Acidimicrobiia bacterium]
MDREIERLLNDLPIFVASVPSEAVLDVVLRYCGSETAIEGVISNRCLTLKLVEKYYSTALSGFHDTIVASTTNPEIVGFMLNHPATSVDALEMILLGWYLPEHEYKKLLGRLWGQGGNWFLDYLDYPDVWVKDVWLKAYHSVSAWGGEDLYLEACSRWGDTQWLARRDRELFSDDELFGLLEARASYPLEHCAEFYQLLEGRPQLWERCGHSGVSLLRGLVSGFDLPQHVGLAIVEHAAIVPGGFVDRNDQIGVETLLQNPGVDDVVYDAAHNKWCAAMGESHPYPKKTDRVLFQPIQQVSDPQLLLKYLGMCYEPTVVWAPRLKRRLEQLVAEAEGPTKPLLARQYRNVKTQLLNNLGQRGSHVDSLSARKVLGLLESLGPRVGIGNRYKPGQTWRRSRVAAPPYIPTKNNVETGQTVLKLLGEPTTPRLQTIWENLFLLYPSWERSYKDLLKTVVVLK